MTRVLVSAAALATALAGCTTIPVKRHSIGRLPADQWAWCLSPDGAIGAWTTSAADGSGGSCAAPSWFVVVPVCGDGQPSHDETATVREARARLGRDGSLYGDQAGGIAFCAPRPPS